VETYLRQEQARSRACSKIMYVYFHFVF